MTDWYTWPDLTPSGDRDIVYATCGGAVGAPEGEAQGNGRPGAKQELTASPTLVLVKAMPAQEAAEFL